MSDPDRQWLPPPVQLRLADDEIHVWRTPLDQGALIVERLKRMLAEDEASRAARFYFEHDRVHFIVARGVLRTLLSQYLGTRPEQLRFSYSSYGKPALSTAPGEPTLNFNVSHSQGLALIAVTRSREIGVDVEGIRPEFAGLDIAERFFSVEENAVLRNLPAELQHEAFFTCWTRKEAYIKARGEGLSHPLDKFDVSLVPGEPARLLKTRGEPHELARWSLRELFAGPGYVAALAAEGNDWRLSCWQWQG
jgi:4'-phosphopantetheinyl transferase